MMHKGTIALTFFVLLPVSASTQQLPMADPDAVGLSSERLQRIDDVFASYAEEGRLGGAVEMVLRHGKIVYTGAWGMRDVAAGDPAEADDIFRIFSMTKPDHQRRGDDAL